MAALLLSGMPASSAAARDLLLAVSKGDRTLAILDAQSLALLSRVPLGPAPHEVVSSTDGKRAYISNNGLGRPEGFYSQIEASSVWFWEHSAVGD